VHFKASLAFSVQFWTEIFRSWQVSLAPPLHTTSCNVHYSGSILNDKRETWSKSRLIKEQLTKVARLPTLMHSHPLLILASQIDESRVKWSETVKLIWNRIAKKKTTSTTGTVHITKHLFLLLKRNSILCALYFELFFVYRNIFECKFPWI
jgi:hypothetical protein